MVASGLLYVIFILIIPCLFILWGWGVQFLREQDFKQTIPRQKVGDEEKISFETSLLH